MQLVQSKNNFIEKICRDKEGRLVRVTFCIYENAGRMKARLIDVVYLEEPVAIESKIFILNGFVNKKFSEIKQTIKKTIVSPYFSFNILSFSGSKPRAPTI